MTRRLAAMLMAMLAVTAIAACAGTQVETPAKFPYAFAEDESFDG